MPEENNHPNIGETPEEKGRIRSLEERLYSRDKTKIHPTKYTELHPKKFFLPEDWKTETNDEDFLKLKPKPKPEKSSIYKYIFIVAVVFFTIASIGSAFFFFIKPNILSPNNVKVSLLGPVSQKGGEVLELQVVIENDNPAPLSSAVLSVALPPGAKTGADFDQDLLTFRKDLGTIAAHERRIETVKALLLGGEKSEQDLHATLTFGIEGEKSTYTKQELYAVTLTAPPIAVSVDMLKEANSGQEITLSIDADSTSVALLHGALIHVDYPVGFTFHSAVPEPSSGNNVWAFGDLPPSAHRHIEVKGVLQGENNQQKSFWVYSGISGQDEKNISVLFSSTLKTLVLQRPFLDIGLTVNGVNNPQAILAPGQDVDVAISWFNTLRDKILNGEIEANVTGPMVRRSSFTDEETGGLYNSFNDTMFWERRTTPSLAAIDTGGQSTVGFKFGLVPLADATGLHFKDPQFDVQVSVRGQRYAETGVPEEIKSFVKKTIKVGTTASLTQKVVYSQGPFPNTGPMPPQAEKETTYTVIWDISNSTSDVDGVQVSSELPPFVRWVGNVDPATSDLSYNDVSHAIIWRVGKIPAGTGFGTPAREIAFQIAFLPSRGQVGASPFLLEPTSFQAKDTFTKGSISSQIQAQSTALQDDPKHTREGGIVLP